MIRDIFRAGAEILFPRVCLVCDRRLTGGRVCSRCLPYSRLNSHAARSEDRGARCSRCYARHDNFTAMCACRLGPSSVGCIRYLWEYEEEVPHLIHAMKYRPSFGLTMQLGEVLAQFALASLPVPLAAYTIVPIPMSAASRRFRPFNQATCLAECIGRALGAPVVDDLLVHRRARPAQASLSHAARAGNMRAAFTVASGHSAAPNVLLVDDVITTGATIAAAASVLLTHGAILVDVIALARSPSFLHWWTTQRLGFDRRTPLPDDTPHEELGARNRFS